jgi:hypothetical protein
MSIPLRKLVAVTPYTAFPVTENSFALAGGKCERTAQRQNARLVQDVLAFLLAEDGVGDA